MSTLALSVTALLALTGAALLFGATRSPEWAVSRTVTVPAPTGAVHRDVSDLRAWAAWSPWSTREDATRVETATGPVAAPGQQLAWTAEKQGSGTMTLTAVDGARVAYDAALPQGVVHGEVTLESAADGTRVTWTIRGEMSNPVGRLFVPVLQHVVGADIDRGLARLRDTHTVPASASLATN